MEQARMDRALNRIEGALDRIVDAARKLPRAAAPTPPADQALRARVTAALADLDHLIAALEP
jgi:hypothetical protein